MLLFLLIDLTLYIGDPASPTESDFKFDEYNDFYRFIGEADIQKVSCFIEDSALPLIPRLFVFNDNLFELGPIWKGVKMNRRYLMQETFF